MSNYTIFSRLQERARLQPDQVALAALGKTDTTFQELVDFVEAARRRLHTLGIGRGTRLGILLSERDQTAAAHLVATSTCTSVPLNPNMTPSELANMIREMSINAVLVGESIPQEMTEMIERASEQHVLTAFAIPHPEKSGLFEIDGQAVDAKVDVSQPEPEDVAVVLHTSGTTAKPKVVPQTQELSVWSVIRLGASYQIQPGQRCLNVMPTHHIQGLTAEFLSPILNGASVLLADFEPGSFIGIVERFNPTWFNLVPSMHQALLGRIGEKQGVFRDSSLKFVRSSSAKLSPSLRQRIESRYGVAVVEGYGSTEGAHLASNGMPGTETRPGSVGRPVHDGVMIADEIGNRLPPGTTGEICVTGPTVISGYENNPAATAEAFRDGWYRTGDQGHFDDDGFLFVTGRTREIISRGGEKFSLAEIDDALLKIDGLSEGAAFAVPDAMLGHEIYAAAVLVPGSDLTPAKIRAAFAQHLSWAKVPKQIFVVQELPKNSVGKILREQLARKRVSG